MMFSITAEQETRIHTWLFAEVYPQAVAEQRKTTAFPTPFHHDCWDQGYPYTGAIGGAVTYQFTPNSIGVTEKAFAFGKELDLTDYESW